MDKNGKYVIVSEAKAIYESYYIRTCFVVSEETS